MTQRLSSYFTDYGEYHRTRGNQACHYIGIPLIACSLLGLLSLVTFGPGLGSVFRADLGLILTLVAVAFYLTLDWKIGLPFAFVVFGLYFIGRALPVPVLLGMQLVGWPVQYVGHLKYERNKPAFYKNLTHMLIGPLWIFSKAVGYTKRSPQV